MLPSWLLWLSPVVLGPLAALLWALWSGRARGPEETVDSVEAYARFRRALATPPATRAVPLRADVPEQARGPERSASQPGGR